MEECNKIREMIIDNYYGEGDSLQIEGHLQGCSDCREFAEKLGLILEDMDEINIDIPVSHYDISSVLNKAEEIQGRRSMRIETALFVFTAISFLTAFGLLTLRLGPMFAVIFQIIVTMNLPLVLLAARKLRDAKEGAR